MSKTTQHAPLDIDMNLIYSFQLCLNKKQKMFIHHVMVFTFVHIALFSWYCPNNTPRKQW